MINIDVYKTSDLHIDKFMDFWEPFPIICGFIILLRVFNKY